jgi:hypothetical protein
MTITAIECRVCGCTKDRACGLMLRGKLIGACSWAETGRRPLCTACAPGSQLELAGVDRQLELAGVKATSGPKARWVRHQRAHIAAARARKVRP